MPQYRRPWDPSILAPFDLSPAEWRCLSRLAVSPIPAALTSRVISSESNSDYRGPLSLDQCVNALAQLSNRQLICEISDVTLSAIKAKLRGLPNEFPVKGYPDVGEMDVTENGGELFRRIIPIAIPTYPPREWYVAVDGSVYAPQVTGIIACLEYRKADELEFSPIQPVFNWYGRWWYKFDTGFCVRSQRSVNS